MRDAMAKFLTVAVVSAAVEAQAYIYTLGNINATVPDNSLNGYLSSQNISGLSGPILGLTVNLTVSGGFNGDLYAFISHNNTTAVLLDRVGLSSSNSVGYANTGFGPDSTQAAFTFSDSASKDVHFYQTGGYMLNGNGQLTGTWQPDARGLDPLSAAAGFDAAARTNTLSQFNGMNPNGQWLFFISDLSPGGVSTLSNWSVNIAAVPEPAVVGLFCIGGALAWGRRFYLKQN